MQLAIKIIEFYPLKSPITYWTCSKSNCLDICAIIYLLILSLNCLEMLRIIEINVDTINLSTTHHYPTHDNFSLCGPSVCVHCVVETIYACLHQSMCAMCVCVCVCVCSVLLYDIEWHEQYTRDFRSCDPIARTPIGWQQKLPIRMSFIVMHLMMQMHSIINIRFSIVQSTHSVFSLHMKCAENESVNCILNINNV